MQNSLEPHREGSVDQHSQPGVEIEAVHLLVCDGRVVDVTAEMRYSMALTKLIRHEDGNTLSVFAEFDLFHGIEKPPCRLRCSFVAYYKRTDLSSMTWTDFSDALAVAHIVPYVREFVSSVTLRMPLRPLVLQPTNAYTLVDAYNARQAQPAPASK